MIYTVTLNPSLDYIVRVDEFRPGQVNRTVEETVCAGGKGINVSFVLKTLGFESTVLGFFAGFTGREIERLVREKGIHADGIYVREGISRINLKLRAREESEINGRGPRIGRDDIEKLYRKLDGLQDGDVLVLAGSIPSVMPESIYRDIMKMVQGKKLQVIVDATGELLMNVLEYRPFLVKPNNHELGEVFDTVLQKREEVIPCAKRMQELGARNVLVSMAGEGAVLLTEDGDILQSEAPGGTVINSVGAGDSMVAGFLAGFLESGDYREAFRMGISAGSASAFSRELATRKEIRRIRENFSFDF